MPINKETYPIIGMHCASCKVLIENSVKKLNGVDDVFVNYATEKMSVGYDDSVIKPEAISDAVSHAGNYKMVTDSDHEITMNHTGHENHLKEMQKSETDSLRNTVILSGLGVLPFLILMIWMYAYPLLKIISPDKLFGENMMYVLYVQFFIATAVIFVAGRSIFSSAFKALSIKAANMDTLIALGTFTSWLYSSVVTFFPKLLNQEGVYFEAGVFIIFFILLGRYLEANSRRQTGSAVKSLIGLQVKKAIVIRDREEIEIDVSEVNVGDIVVIRPGVKFPVDGIIIDGMSTVDESMISGEPMPVDKKQGDKVITGTINNDGYLVYRAEKVGNDTVLGQIIKMVEQAQGSRADIQHLADKVAGIFVPVVIVIAFITLIVWLIVSHGDYSKAIYAFISVLIIACPCALGLATPTAIVAASGAAARNGILIKDARTLEKAGKLKHVVFDKTGTITVGFPEVFKYRHLSSKVDEKGTMEAVLSLESMSEHPLAQAISSYLSSKNSQKVEVRDFKNIPGKGVTGKVEESEYFIGRPSKIEKLLVIENATPVEVVRNNDVIGMFFLRDSIKENSARIVQKLNLANINTYLLTGDNNSNAKFTADKVGLKNVIAEVLPSQKAGIIEDIKRNHPKELVAMVGDGINDSPALATADVGIAMGTGTDIAMQTGDVILLGGDLARVPLLIKISKKTLKIIKENLFWAFGYNTIGIPIAAGVLYPFTGTMLSPAIAAAAMALSSISVVMNSLRLKKAPSD